MFEMKPVDSESSSDVARWLRSASADLWPAVLGSLSLRWSRCIRENCPACLSGEQHQSYVLYGRANGRRVAVYVPEELVPEVQHSLDNGARSAGSAAPGGTAIHQSAEARARRSIQKQEEPSDVRATARQISFADWELMRQRDQGIRLEPLLEAISGFLDDQREVIERVRRDLVRDLKQPDSGRHGLTATQVLRSLVLMRLKNWDYRELRERIADGLTLRQFTDFYCAPVPKHDAFQRGFIRLTPQTLKVVNDLLVRAGGER